MPGFTHIHAMQPYGWVRMINCQIEEREVPQYGDRGGGQYQQVGTTIAQFVVGTVEDSSYCGALWGGVPVRKPDNTRYPPGTRHECRVRHPSDLVNGQTTDVAM